MQRKRYMKNSKIEAKQNRHIEAYAQEDEDSYREAPIVVLTEK